MTVITQMRRRSRREVIRFDCPYTVSFNNHPHESVSELGMMCAPSMSVFYILIDLKVHTMNTRKHTLSALLSLVICFVTVIGPRIAHADFSLSAQPHRQTQLSRSAQSLNSAQPEQERTSRDIRRDTILQTSLHASHGLCPARR